METEQKPDIIKFLLGESDYDGYWYGDQADHRPPFWWRIPLRTYIEGLQEENKRLKENYDHSQRVLDSYRKLLEEEKSRTEDSMKVLKLALDLEACRKLLEN